MGFSDSGMAILRSWDEKRLSSGSSHGSQKRRANGSRPVPNPGMGFKNVAQMVPDPGMGFKNVVQTVPNPGMS